MLNLPLKPRCGKLMPLIFCFAFYFPGSGHAQPADVTDSGKHQIFLVIRSGDTAKLEQLLQNGADANAKEYGYTALMAAALDGTAAEMEILIGHGARVNEPDENGFTALWFGVPDYDKAALLIKHGADPQLRSKEGFTVLPKLANYAGTLKIFQLLMDHGADLLHSGPDNSLLYNAASSCDTAVLGMLIDHGLSVNDTTAVGDYPINSALNYRCFACLKILVDHGARVNVAPVNLPLPPMEGMTPLMFAGVSGDSLSFFYLLAHGADPNACNSKGYTVLMFVQQAGNEEPEMTRALLKRGANPLKKARDQTDALSLALLKGNTQTVQMLKVYAHK